MVSEIGRLKQDTCQNEPKGLAIDRSEAPGNVDWRLKRKQNYVPKFYSLWLIGNH